MTTLAAPQAAVITVPLRAIGLAVATALAAAVVLQPGLDVAVARLFFTGDRVFIGQQLEIVGAMRAIFLGLYAGACVMAVCGLVMTRRQVRAWFSLVFSQWLFLDHCLGVGPGVVANLALKDQWGRARPNQIVEFGGTKQFAKPFQASDQCLRNCSFVSGEASSIFALFFALAFLWRSRWRTFTAAGLAAGALAGLIRMAQGAHFLTDVIFAAAFMALTVAAIHYIFEAVATSALRSAGYAAR